MRTFFVALFCLVSWSSLSVASEQPLQHTSVDVFDQLSVIRGAGYFADYCMGCHGIKQIRYSRVMKDLKLSESKLRETLLFGDLKVHQNIEASMSAQQGEAIFGVEPPDLSLVVRSRGADWVYTYLKSFYVDEKRPYGVNNTVLPNAAMPNVLWALQGEQYPKVHREHGEDKVVGVELVQKGQLNPAQFDRVVGDIVNFLAYVGEPSQLQRVPLGKYVIAFLLFLTFIFYKLKKEYWKDID